MSKNVSFFHACFDFEFFFIEGFFQFYCFLMKVGVILSAIFNPVILMNCYETVKEKVRLGAKDFEQTNLSRKLYRMKKVKLDYLKYLTIDLNLECIYQTFGQIILVFLSSTNTPTTGGLDEFFRKDSVAGFPIEAVLTLSIIWSLKTLILLHLKRISTEKGFLPFTAKLAIFFWGTMANTKRILSMTSFFIPSLGLFNILYHWQAEQLPFYVRKSTLKKRLSNNLELYNMTEQVLWSDIDRWNYNDTKLWEFGISVTKESSLDK